MRKLLNPKWLLVINSLPVTVLFLILYGQFNIIESQLTDEEISLWGIFGGILFSITAVHVIYVFYLIFKQKKLPIQYGFVALGVYISYIYAYTYHLDRFVSFNIPVWMMPEETIFYVGTFLMPTLVHALLVIINQLTPKEGEHKAWKAFLYAISIPIGWYVFSQVLFPLWRHFDTDFFNHIIIIFGILGVVLFLFFLIRGIFIVASSKQQLSSRKQLLWKIPITLIFPLLGLAINNGLIDGIDRFLVSTQGIFGDFTSKWFYILAIANAIFLCLPNSNHIGYRTFVFAGRSIFFAYTLYFFIVFLPFLPFSVIAILGVGVGFLMLTPLVLFVIHVQQLSNDYHFLKTTYANGQIVVYGLIAFLTIPLLITFSFKQNKNTLHETLDFIYNPDFTQTYRINTEALRKTIKVLKTHNERSRGFMFGNQTPFLDPFFNWLVLDNLTVSSSKINTIEQVFFNHQSLFNTQASTSSKDSVDITKLIVNSEYDAQQNAWLSWVDLELTNHATSRRQMEYATTLNLPPGCWISDYYLYVEDEKEYGILAEKKAAMWVYSQIRNTRRDPGLLHYLSGNKVLFRVFPFRNGEVRKTGIQFIHKEPVTLNFDGQEVVLGDKNQQQTSELTYTRSKNVTYVSSVEKAQLQTLKRKPYYHFIVDVSAGKDSLKQDYIKQIEATLKTNNEWSRAAKISFTNTYTTTIDFTENWQETLLQQVCEGGFYLERGIKKTLFNTVQHLSATYPIIVVVSNSFEQSIIGKDFANFEFTYPESNLYYHLDAANKLIPHSLSITPKEALADTTLPSQNYTVLAWPNIAKPQAYLRNDSLPSIVLKQSIVELDDTLIKERQWSSGLEQQGSWMSQTLYPETSTKSWLSLIKTSFQSKIMTPLTAYMVVENEAQKAMLKKKQEQVLSGHKSLDIGEGPQSMSEPGLLLMVFLMAGLLLFRSWLSFNYSKNHKEL